VKTLIAAILLTATSVAQAAPLTVQPGESWIFVVKNGEPANAHKVAASAKPGKNQLMVTMRTILGTNMIVTNNSPVAYTFRAELFRGGKPAGVRPCTLPANNQPIFEQWQEKADAIRISRFQASGTEGQC
jgi:hypothetical protein